MLHDLIARPSRWTVHAPHWAVSQPMCVPVRRNSSRRNWTSRMWGSTVAVTALPLTVRLMLSAMLLSPSGDKQPKLTHRFCFTGLADFTIVSVWLGSCLFVVAMSKAQNEDRRYWAKGGVGASLCRCFISRKTLVKTPPRWVA